MGDPSGIGPEVVAAALKDPRVRSSCIPLVIGSRQALQQRGFKPRLASILDPGIFCKARPGHPTQEGARASFEAVRLALKLTTRGLSQAMVTAPISKEAWSEAGVAYRDHTEYLQAALHCPKACMMMISGDLRAVLATRHLSLKDAIQRLTPQVMIEATRSAHRALLELGIKRPCFGICGLNPHAGENGLLGREEGRILVPAIRSLRRSGLCVEGPLAADAAWAKHSLGSFDALVTLYHDQAMIPLKLSRPFGVVNWTAGLPIVRTSPGHGTAFDIAGSGRANPQAMIEASLLAAKLAVWRNITHSRR